MKKIFFALSIFALMAATAPEVEAQAMTNPNALALDSASQAAAEGPTIKVDLTKKNVVLVLKTTKISGTITGTVKWQGALTAAGDYATISSDTLVDASNNYTVKLTDNCYPYLRALITQTGTSSMSYSGRAGTSGKQ